MTFFGGSSDLLGSVFCTLIGFFAGTLFAGTVGRAASSSIAFEDKSSFLLSFSWNLSDRFGTFSSSLCSTSRFSFSTEAESAVAVFGSFFSSEGRRIGALNILIHLVNRGIGDEEDFEASRDIGHLVKLNKFDFRTWMPESELRALSSLAYSTDDEHSVV